MTCLKNAHLFTLMLLPYLIYISVLLLQSCITPFCITAAVNKMIKEMIPNVRVSNDARELILNCCTG